MNFTITTDVKQDDLIDSLASLSYSEIISFIKVLDLTIADWDFTKQLYSYLKEEMEKYEKEKIDSNS